MFFACNLFKQLDITYYAKSSFILSGFHSLSKNFNDIFDFEKIYNLHSGYKILRHTHKKYT